MSGMCPPLGEPSLIMASEISHVENAASLAGMSVPLDDISRKQTCLRRWEVSVCARRLARLRI